jgi:hypothetical protein
MCLESHTLDLKVEDLVDIGGSYASGTDQAKKCTPPRSLAGRFRSRLPKRITQADRKRMAACGDWSFIAALLH